MWRLVKRVLFTVMLCVVSLSTLAKDMEFGVGFDIGWNQNIYGSGGINFGALGIYNGVTVGFDICKDITGTMPNEINPYGFQVDLSGDVRFGYCFKNGFGFGALLGGYRAAVEYLGTYLEEYTVYNWNYYPSCYYTNMYNYQYQCTVHKIYKDYYACVSGFEGGLYLMYIIPSKNERVGCYLIGTGQYRDKVKPWEKAWCIGLSIGILIKG